MQYTKLGNSDLYVSRICMGCMGFGNAATGQHSWTLDEAASREIIKRGLELGVNFFDTAIGYQNGTSEEYLGRALKDFARREDVVVATKFPGRSPQEMEAGVTGQQHVANLLDQSLRHLGMDYVDLYIYHMWDYATPLYEILEGLSNAVKAGKARYVGISNCFAYQLAKANALAEKEGFPKFVSIQGHYNLIFREEEREMAKLCAEDNIAMTPYSALAGGRLSKHPGETSKRLEEDSYAKSAKSHRAGGGRHQAPPHRGRGQGGGAGALPPGDDLSGGALRAPQAGGRDGPKHPCRRGCQAGMDCKVKRRNLACLIFRGKTRNSRNALSTSPLTKW